MGLKNLIEPEFEGKEMEIYRNGKKMENVELVSLKWGLECVPPHRMPDRTKLYLGSFKSINGKNLNIDLRNDRYELHINGEKHIIEEVFGVEEGGFSAWFDFRKEN